MNTFLKKKGMFVVKTLQYTPFAKLVRTTSFALTLLGLNLVQAQTPGFIYKTSSTAFGRSVLDPNGDGYTSPTNSGFSGTDYGSGSELRMIPIPVLMGEPLNDLSTGGSGGHTDIANSSDGGANSVYVLKRTVGGIDYLILRYRVGGASTATKGYSVLFDTDGQFGTIWNGNNPGFDREVVYETGNNGRVAIYKHTSSGTQLMSSYNVHEYSQRSVALSNAGGNPDYFYDFFIPLEALDAPNMVRFAAATITSAGSGITGTVSDFNGVDDKLYNNNQLLIMQELINIFPAVTLADLDENFDASGWKMKTLKPTVTAPISNDATSVTGFCAEPNGTVITVYKDGVSIGTTTVTGGAWTLSSITTPLATGKKITATATASGKTVSDLSSYVIVGGGSSTNNSVICYNEAPQITGYVNSSKLITISWDPNKSQNTTVGTVKFYIYQVGINTPFHTSQSINISGSTYTYTVTLGNASYYVVAERGCLSNPSIIRAFASNGNMSTPAQTTITAPDLPAVVTAFSGAQNVSVTNKDASDARLSIFVNGTFIDSTTSLISSNASHNFSLTNLKEDDFITAFAHRTVRSNRDSVTVTANVQTNPPVVTGTYFPSTSGNVTITGTSPSPAGTLINLYHKGNGVLGSVPYTSLQNTSSSSTTTVNSYGQWSFVINTATYPLATGDTIVATATAGGKTESVFSNKVVVLPARPSAPVITSANVLANTTNTLSGTISGNSDSIVLYVDGIRIGVCIPTSGGN